MILLSLKSKKTYKKLPFHFKDQKSVLLSLLIMLLGSVILPIGLSIRLLCFIGDISQQLFYMNIWITVLVVRGVYPCEYCITLGKLLVFREELHFQFLAVAIVQSLTIQGLVAVLKAMVQGSRKPHRWGCFFAIIHRIITYT